MTREEWKDSQTNDLGMDLYWHFTADAIDATPDMPGVFALFDDRGRHIVLGSAIKSLRATFRSHWKGLEGRSTCGASYMAWEQHADPLTREAEIAAKYARQFGRIARRKAG
jgi:hypothetical protein